MKRLLTAIILVFCLGSCASIFADSLDEGYQAIKSKNYKKAAEIMRPLAEKGDANAQDALGLLYLGGFGVPQDFNEAARWYRKAAEQGHAGAQNNLGTMYYDGRGVKKDYEEAGRWLRKAAEQGEVHAQKNLGGMYRDGLGVPQDDKEAIEWFRKAARQGYILAYTALGVLYEENRGITQRLIEEKRNKLFNNPLNLMAIAIRLRAGELFVNDLFGKSIASLHEL
jgi:TPR repeat protein